MAAAIPDRGWYPRWDPPSSPIQRIGEDMCMKFTPPMCVGVPETVETLTGEKPASSVRELPPP